MIEINWVCLGIGFCLGQSFGFIIMGLIVLYYIKKGYLIEKK